MEKYAILKGYLDENGKFKSMPGRKQRKKIDLMLSYLAEKFEFNRTYTEKEVNELLNQYHNFNDPATLRRMLFGCKLLGRTLDGRAYWLIN